MSFGIGSPIFEEAALVSRVRDFLEKVEDTLDSEGDRAECAREICSRRNGMLVEDLQALRGLEAKMETLRSRYPGILAEVGPLVNRARHVFFGPTAE